MTNGEDYDSERSDGEKENEDDIENVKERKHRLFNIVSVNASGNLDVDQIKDDGRPLKLERKANTNIGTFYFLRYLKVKIIFNLVLTNQNFLLIQGKLYLAVEFDERVKEKCFNEKELQVRYFKVKKKLCTCYLIILSHCFIVLPAFYM